MVFFALFFSLKKRRYLCADRIRHKGLKNSETTPNGTYNGMVKDHKIIIFSPSKHTIAHKNNCFINISTYPETIISIASFYILKLNHYQITS